MSDNISLINHHHDIKGEVIQFKDEFMCVKVANEHQVEVEEFILALYKGKQIEAKVISVKPDEIGLFIPLLPDNYFTDRRNFPRVKVDLPAVIIQEIVEPTGVLERVIHVRLHDVSHRGFSFTIDSGDELHLEWTSRIIVQSEQLPILCDIIANNHNGESDPIRYSARIQFINNTNMHLLFHYLFAKQA